MILPIQKNMVLSSIMESAICKWVIPFTLTYMVHANGRCIGMGIRNLFKVDYSKKIDLNSVKPLFNCYNGYPFNMDK